MPLEQVRKEIEAKTAEELERMRKDAHHESKKIISDAEARAKEIASLAASETAKELEGRKIGMEAAIDMEAKRIVLDALEEALDSEVSRIRKELERKLNSSETYGQLFSSAKRKVAVLGEGYIIAVEKSNAKIAEAAFGKSATIEHAQVDGIMMYSKDRMVSIDMTIPTIARAAIDEARGEILRALSGTKGASAVASSPKQKIQKPKAASGSKKGKKRG